MFVYYTPGEHGQWGHASKVGCPSDTLPNLKRIVAQTLQCPTCHASVNMSSLFSLRERLNISINLIGRNFTQKIKDTVPVVFSTAITQVLLENVIKELSNLPASRESVLGAAALVIGALGIAALKATQLQPRSHFTKIALVSGVGAAAIALASTTRQTLMSGMISVPFSALKGTATMGISYIGIFMTSTALGLLCPQPEPGWQSEAVAVTTASAGALLFHKVTKILFQEAPIGSLSLFLAHMAVTRELHPNALVEAGGVIGALIGKFAFYPATERTGHLAVPIDIIGEPLKRLGNLASIDIDTTKTCSALAASVFTLGMVLDSKWTLAAALGLQFSAQSLNGASTLGILTIITGAMGNIVERIKCRLPF